jgi:hypothetical protein
LTGDEEQKLLAILRRLDAGRRRTLLEFAEFLAARTGDGETAAREPLPIARPREETVVMALKRLTRTYPMLDRRRLLAETSRFIAEHALEGRPAREVVDELEAVFARQYERMREEL